MHAEPLYARRSLEAGAHGYVSKNAAPDELLAAVRRVAAGGRYVEAEIAQALALGAGAEALDALSPRELEIMRLLAAGSSLAEIADALGASLQDHRQHLHPDQIQARRRPHRRPGAPGDRDGGIVATYARRIGTP